MLQRTFKTERLYSLGDYKNIKFTDEIIDVPADIAFNPEVVSRIRLLQLIGVELSFKRYQDLGKELTGKTPEQMAEYLEKVKTETTEELVGLLNGRLANEDIAKKE